MSSSEVETLCDEHVYYIKAMVLEAIINASVWFLENQDMAIIEQVRNIEKQVCILTIFTIYSSHRQKQNI